MEPKRVQDMDIRKDNVKVSTVPLSSGQSREQKYATILEVGLWATSALAEKKQSNIIFWLRLSVCMSVCLYVSMLFPDFSKTTKDN